MPGSHHNEKKFRKDPEREAVGLHGPYWMRAHRDWRFLAVIFAMLAAMLIYLFTNNLSWLPHAHYFAPQVLGILGN